MVKKSQAGMKKPALLLALAVLILAGSPAVFAQESSTSKATNGRFTTDVDNFISTTGWAGVPLENWFGYMNLGNSEGGIGDPVSPADTFAPDYWEIGFAKKLSTLYIGLFYKGSYWDGSTGWGEITDNMDGTLTGPTIDASTWDGQSVPSGLQSPPGSGTVDGGVTSGDKGNQVAVLVGLQNGHAIKFGIKEENAFKRREGSVVITGDGPDKLGFARYLDGVITPSVEWGTANPLALGSFSIKPKAGLALAVKFKEFEAQWDSETKGSDFTQNSLTPSLFFDSGGAEFKTWTCGSLAAGIVEKLGFTYKDVSDGEDAQAKDWVNVLIPYARFTQTVDDSFTLKAALDVPFSIHEDRKLGFYDRMEQDAGNAEKEHPRLRVGAQYQFKSGKLADKLAINAGVLVVLPTLSYKDADPDDSDGDGVYESVKEDDAWTWKKPDTYQKLDLGASFKFTPKAMLDLYTQITLSPDDSFHLLDNQITKTLLNWGALVFSLTF